jgi:phosphohistidine phosphatase
MRVLILRHAIAVERGTPGIADDERPLTPEGRVRFERAARGLARITQAPDVLLTSPLLRARQTADIAARAFEIAAPKTAEALIEARFSEVARLLLAHRGASLCALVGHDPSLSALIARWLGSSAGERFPLRKGHAVLLELDEATPRRKGAPAGDAARLIWSLPPKILRALA